MNHDAICARLPHAGRMCLLDRLEAWDGDSITCFATSHRDAHNPLRRAGRLPAVAGVEYAAQAMALHGNLLSALHTSTAMDGGSAGNAGAVFRPTAMDGGSAGREAVPTGTNAGAVLRPTAMDGGRFRLLPSRGITPSMEGRSAGRAAVPSGINAGAVLRPTAMGYLASVRDLKLDIDDLAGILEDLDITARRLSGDSTGIIYEFEIHAGARRLLSGRLAARLVATAGADA